MGPGTQMRSEVRKVTREDPCYCLLSNSLPALLGFFGTGSAGIFILTPSGVLSEEAGGNSSIPVVGAAVFFISESPSLGKIDLLKLLEPGTVAAVVAPHAASFLLRLLRRHAMPTKEMKNKTVPACPFQSSPGAVARNWIYPTG